MDKYDLHEAIGKGAFGTVYRGVRKSDGLVIAVKVQNNIQYTWQQVLEQREVDVFQNCYHVNIVPLLEQIQSERGILHFVFEYYPYDLLKCIKEPQLLGKDNQTLEDMQSIMTQIFTGLAYQHSKGYMHRDQKPENILIKKDSKTSQLYVVLADLGLARKFSYTSKTSIPEGVTFHSEFTSYIATRWYRAPELLLFQPYTQTIDLWAAGCIFVDLILGTSLFMGSNSDDTLRKIASILGSPAPHLYPSLHGHLGVMPRTNQKHVFRKLFALEGACEDTMEAGFQLLLSCLDWDPVSRVTAEQARNWDLFTISQDAKIQNTVTAPVLTNQLRVKTPAKAVKSDNNGLSQHLTHTFNHPLRNLDPCQTYVYQEDWDDMQDQLQSGKDTNVLERRESFSWMIFSNLLDTKESTKQTDVSIPPTRDIATPVSRNTHSVVQNTQNRAVKPIMRLATGKHSEYGVLPTEPLGVGFSRSIPQLFSSPTHVTLPIGKYMVDSSILSLLQVRLAFYWTVDVPMSIIHTVRDRIHLPGVRKQACLIMKDGILSTCRTQVQSNNNNRDSMYVQMKLVQYNLSQLKGYKIYLDLDVEAMLRDAVDIPLFLLSVNNILKSGNIDNSNYNYGVDLINYHDDDIFFNNVLKLEHVKKHSGTRPNTAANDSKDMENKRQISHEEHIVVETYRGGTQVGLETVKCEEEDRDNTNLLPQHAPPSIAFPKKHTPVKHNPDQMDEEYSEEEQSVRRWDVHEDISSDEFGI